MGAEGIKAA